VNWVYLAQFMVQCRGFVNTILKLTVPWKAENILTSITAIRFSSLTLQHGVTFI